MADDGTTRVMDSDFWPIHLAIQFELIDTRRYKYEIISRLCCENKNANRLIKDENVIRD
jgi:hypothetical protein